MSTGTMVTDLPTGSGWFFGGLPYGLEPLTLPSPGVTDDALGHPASDDRSVKDYDGACRLILRTGGPAPLPANDGTAHELYWFRWITGHQVRFVVWPRADFPFQGTVEVLDEIAPVLHCARRGAP
jgi:hypothetical protein